MMHNINRQAHDGHSVTRVRNVEGLKMNLKVIGAPLPRKEMQDQDNFEGNDTRHVNVFGTDTCRDLDRPGSRKQVRDDHNLIING